MSDGRFSCRFALLVLVAIATSAAEVHPYVHDREVWIGRGNKLDQVTNDGLYKDSLTLAPSGDAIAYITYCDNGGTSQACPPTIVFRDLTGKLLYSFPPIIPDDGKPCLGGIVQFDWINKGRIGFACHLNPSLSEYTITDIATAKPIKSYYGGPFAWSPDRKQIAYGGWVPHFSPPYAHSFWLRIDDPTVYPIAPPGNSSPGLPEAPRVFTKLGSIFSGIHELASDLVWSPDGKEIVFLERIYDWLAPTPSALSGGDERADRYQMAIVYAQGNRHSEVLTLDHVTRQPYSIQWTSNNEIELRGDSNGEWRMRLTGNGLTLSELPQ